MPLSSRRWYEALHCTSFDVHRLGTCFVFRPRPWNKNDIQSNSQCLRIETKKHPLLIGKYEGFGECPPAVAKVMTWLVMCYFWKKRKLTDLIHYRLEEDIKVTLEQTHEHEKFINKQYNFLVLLIDLNILLKKEKHGCITSSKMWSSFITKICLK